MFSKKIFALRIRALRLDMGLSMAEFGKAFGVSDEAVRLWEKEKRSPKLEDLATICQFTQAPYAFLVNEPPFQCWEYLTQTDMRPTTLLLLSEYSGLTTSQVEAMPLAALALLFTSLFSRVEHDPEKNEVTFYLRREPTVKVEG